MLCCIYFVSFSETLCSIQLVGATTTTFTLITEQLKSYGHTLSLCIIRLTQNYVSVKVLEIHLIR